MNRDIECNDLLNIVVALPTSAHCGASGGGSCLAPVLPCALDQLAHVLLEEVGVVEVTTSVPAAGV